MKYLDKAQELTDRILDLTLPHWHPTKADFRKAHKLAIKRQHVLDELHETERINKKSEIKLNTEMNKNILSFI